jgi:hypothetical protein
MPIKGAVHKKMPGHCPNGRQDSFILNAFLAKVSH